MSATQRNRSRSRALHQSTMVYTVIVGSGNSVSTTYTVGEDKDSMTDWVVPNFYQRRKQGEIFNHPCSYGRTNAFCEGSALGSYRANNGSSQYTNAGPLTWYRGFKPGADFSPGAYTAPDGSNAEYAKQKAVANIDGTPYAFGEDVLEIGETIRYLKNPLAGLARLSDTYRKAVYERSVRRAANGRSIGMAKAHAQVYLEHRFALTPLIRSVVDIQQAYNDKPKTPPDRLSARGFERFETEIARTKTVVNGSTTTYAETARREVDIHASILYTVSNPIYDNAWRFGLRAKDLPATIWAVMPYSFMVDRVLDVSSFVKGVMNMTDPNIRILAASVRRKDNHERRSRIVSESYPGWTMSVSGETYVQTNFAYGRSVWIPSINDAVPALRPKGLVEDATKVADLVSLIVANYRR